VHRDQPTREPDFDRRARAYDALRPQDENWWELFALLVREADLEGRRVLDCGCGTGRLAAALAERCGARVWGVDPSREMLAEARRRLPRSVGVKAGRAEAIPFQEGWFERAVLWLVVHLLDRARAFAELRRVLGPSGRLAVLTFDTAHFQGFWLNRLFPSLEGVDRARFPSEQALRLELEAAGFVRLRLLRVSQAGALPRAQALERIRGRHISTFDLLSEQEYAAGLVRAERELPERVEYRLEWLLAVAER
jgi:ubiquinone/menaquinone biosynthesis C-methylase UbiE